MPHRKFIAAGGTAAGTEAYSLLEKCGMFNDFALSCFSVVIIFVVSLVCGIGCYFFWTELKRLFKKKTQIT